MIEDVLIGKDGLNALNYELGQPLETKKYGRKLMEKFAIKKISVFDVDSIYRYYDKELNDIEFSFSPGLDAKKKSKLYKTLFIQNPIPKGVYSPDFEIPRREAVYELILIKGEDPLKYKKIIDRFKQDRATMKINN
ncbi:hypothetical protein D9M68_807430 [compost metagenome]